MTGLEPREDQVVRDAVDAYLDGSLGRRFEGEMAFETKNSRYRLVDGTLFSAPDSSLVGAELVGWFYETPRPVVDLAWKPGARAVLVDRNRGRHIIVTSGTRALQMEVPIEGPTEIQASAAPPPAPIPQPPPVPARRVAPHLPPRPVGHLSPPPPRAGSSPAIQDASPPHPPRPVSSPAIQVASPPRPGSSSAIHVAAPPPPPRPASSPAIQAAAPPRPPRPVSSPAIQAPSPPPGGYVLPPVQPPPMRAAAPQPPPDEDSEDLRVTEERERPLPLVVRRASPGADASTPVHDAPANTASGAPKSPAPRSVQRGALLR